MKTRPMGRASLNDSCVRKQQLKTLLEEGESVNNEDKTELDKILSIKHIIQLSDIIIQKGDVMDRVQNTSEVVMDAQIMKMSHELLGKIMEKVVNSEFSDEEFQNGLAKVVLNNNGQNWDELAKIAIQIAHTTKFSCCLLGAIDSEVTIIEKEAIARDREHKSKSRTTKETQPEPVKEIEKTDEGAKRVNIILKQIQKLYNENNNHPIPFYKLVIDPDNFINTIDNVFQVSFLVRENKLGVITYKHGYPAIIVKSKDEQKSGSFINTDIDTIQTICSFNPIFISRMIKKYGIVEPILPVNI